MRICVRLGYLSGRDREWRMEPEGEEEEEEEEEKEEAEIASVTQAALQGATHGNCIN